VLITLGAVDIEVASRAIVVVRGSLLEWIRKERRIIPGRQHVNAFVGRN
jgi:hypothetical protein